MASKDPDENCNTETEEETIALMKKRARRVSFAETTAVHFFDRDEESDKTAASAEASEDDWLRRTESDEIMALLHANDVSAEEDDDYEGPPRTSFFRPNESPSPASSTFGSATSNDEEHYFGPISADFIKRGLSNSAGDDANHDITMDSATFSMHFRSLAKSDSGGGIKTPTGFRLAFGESSQTKTTTSNIGNSMVLTMVKSPIALSSPATKGITGSCSSNDMSLVQENSDRYDYGRLSPELGALLAEGQQDVKAVLTSSNIEGPFSADYMEQESNFDGVYQNGTLLHLMDHTPNIPSEPVSPSPSHEEKNVLCAQSPVDQRTQDISLIEEYVPKTDKHSIGTNSNQMEDVSADQESIRNVEKQSKRKADFDKLGTLSDLNTEKQVGSFLTGSISSLSVKRRQIFKDVTNSIDHHQTSTRLWKESGSFRKKGSDRLIFSLPLPEKSISRLKRLEPSPLASLDGGGVIHSRTFLSGSMNSILEGKILNQQFNHVDAPVVCLEEQFSSVCRDSEKKINDINDFQMLNQTVSTRQSVRVEHISEDNIPSIPANGSFISEEGVVAGVSLFCVTSLGNQELEHHLSTDNAADVNLLSSGSDSSLLEITLDDKKHVKALPLENELTPAKSQNNSKTLLETPTQSYTASLSKDGHSIATPITPFGLSSVIEEEPLTSESMEYQQNPLETPTQPHTVTLHEGRNLIANAKVTDNPASETENPGLLIDCGMSDSGSVSKLKYFVNVASEISINDKKNVLTSLQLNAQTPERHGVSELHQLSSSNKSIRTARGATIVAEEHPTRANNYQHEQFLLSSIEEPCYSAHDHEVLEGRSMDALTLDCDQLSIENAGSNLQNAIDKHDENYSLKTRNLGGKLGADMEKATDILHTYHNLLNDCNQSAEIHSGCFNEINTVTQNTGSGKRRQNLTDVFRNYDQLIEKWCSSSIVKLDTHSVEKLEDIMASLQKFAASKIICSNIYAQKVSKEFDHAQLKRSADTKLLMYKTLYGKVKLKLTHLKKKRLVNQIELLQSAVQESKLLKSNCCLKLHGSIQQVNEVAACNSQSCSSDQDKNKATGDSVSTLKNALEDTERKIENLSNSFHTSLKIPREPNSNEIIAIVMDYLKRKAPCWFLQQEFQLWEVDNAENKNGQLDVSLNYEGLISQRFELKHKPKSSISISSELISTRIAKTWPNMSASDAFQFALSAKTTLKYTGPVIFAQETQRTSLLLSNLCDVLEEVKLAQIELTNLTKSSFCLPSVGRLDLQLMFINYNDGKRVELTLDMSCLSCGVYPSEIIPYEIRDTSTDKHSRVSQSMLDEIKAAIAGLRGGYMRLLRLCRCVSNAIHSGSSRR